ncbi:MAG: PDZ domain-containing protein [Porticoccaceae bacterium]|nr:PDZ domain-containing protein [Porticoccaceae bacterium]MBT6319422.1 PDZ domain-containing protein [Porticoccaceae bacterium]MBT7258261.1 PDZ domain-containing protein [Porticoccaceae bacterium]MBT7905026.1 PDZ domain-containing protein [Porticoccaceae bacterium]
MLMLVFPEFRNQPGAEIAAEDSGQDAQPGHWSGPVSYSAAVSRAAPSVVNIYTRKVARAASHPLLNDPFFRRLYNLQQQRMQSSLGSGVIMQDDGFVVTNFHVVDDVDEILMLLYDGREVPATVVGTDPDTDLAVLKIEATGLQPISVGEPAQAKIGDVVLAIGNPYGVGQTVTQGIVSATGRNGLGLNTFENFIQTDADINPGNSGGALVDAYGNLLGINTAKINRNGSAGISFAIPADAVEKVLKDIIQYGRVVRGWLGMEALPLTPQFAKQLNLRITSGLLVQSIVNGGPAYSANIRPGDIVVSINGISVTDRHSSISQIAEVMPGKPIQLGILRSGQTFEVTAVAGSRPSIPQ